MNKLLYLEGYLIKLVICVGFSVTISTGLVN